VDRGLQLNPNGLGLWETKIKLAITEKGDLGMCEKALEKAKSIPMSNEEKLKTVGARVDFLLLQRKFKEVLELAQTFPDDLFTSIPGSLALKYFAIGLANKALGNETDARPALL